MNPSETYHTLDAWLQALGFQFDPFQYLEASGDARLGEYLIGHETFASAWAESPTCIFAPAGGGKTAMHVYTTRACWVGVGGFHPFPIPYLLSSYRFEQYPPGAEVHLRHLVRAGAIALLIGLSFRPERFLELDATSRRVLAAFLSSTLPGPLPRYLSILRQTGTPFALPPLLHRAYVLPNPPEATLLVQLCDTLEAAVPATIDIPTAPAERFEELIELLVSVLKFRSVLVLVDGADAFPETSNDPYAITEGLVPLFVQAAQWARRKIYLKGFLPIEMEPVLYEDHPDLVSHIARTRLEWSQHMLAELIRKRVYVASGGKFDSLDAVSSPELRDVESLVAPSVVPLPREILIFIQHVLFAGAKRTGGSAGSLEPRDIEAALDWYRTQPRNLLSEKAGLARHRNADR